MMSNNKIHNVISIKIIKYIKRYYFSPLIALSALALSWLIYRAVIKKKNPPITHTKQVMYMEFWRATNSAAGSHIEPEYCPCNVSEI